MDIKRELNLMKEDSYRDFIKGLNPGVDNILGVRIPKLRGLAKELSPNWDYYFKEIEEDYYEELMLKAFVLAYAKVDFETKKPYLVEFIGKISSWSVCDSFVSSLNFKKSDKDLFWEFIKPYSWSKLVYSRRFFLVASLRNFLEEPYIEDLELIYREMNYEEYYVNMALAWALASYYTKDPDRAYDYIESGNFSEDLIGKTIRKIQDSRRISSDNKKRALRLK